MKRVFIQGNSTGSSKPLLARIVYDVTQGSQPGGVWRSGCLPRGWRSQCPQRRAQHHWLSPRFSAGTWWSRHCNKNPGGKAWWCLSRWWWRAGPLHIPKEKKRERRGNTSVQRSRRRMTYSKDHPKEQHWRWSKSLASVVSYSPEGAFSTHTPSPLSTHWEECRVILLSRSSAQREDLDAVGQELFSPTALQQPAKTQSPVCHHH